MFWLEAAGAVARQEGAMKISCQHFAVVAAGKNSDLTAFLPEWENIVKKSNHVFRF